MSAAPRQSTNALKANAAAMSLPDLFAAIVAAHKARSDASHNHKPGGKSPGFRCTWPEEGAVVEIVSVEVAVPDPGVRLDGENEQDARGGRPEHEREIGFVKGPPTGETFIANVALLPGFTDEVRLLAEMEKSGGGFSSKAHIPRPCVPAHSVRVCASIVRPSTATKGMPAASGDQVAPPSFVLNTPMSVAA